MVDTYTYIEQDINKQEDKSNSNDLEESIEMTTYSHKNSTEEYVEDINKIIILNENASNASSHRGSTENNYSIFTEARNENLTRIQKELEDLQCSAVSYASELIQQITYFEQIMQYINSLSNSYINTLMKYLGETGEVQPNRVNFFIYATYAWVFEILRHGKIELQEKINEEGKLTFDELMKCIKDMSHEISKEEFLSVYGVFISLARIHDVSASAMLEPAFGFFQSMSIIIEQSGDCCNVCLNKTTFEESFMDMFRMAVNLTLTLSLNAINSNFQFDEIFNFYTVYKAKTKETLFTELKNYFDRKNVLITDGDLVSLQAASLDYISFSEKNFEEIFFNLKKFLENNSSIKTRLMRVFQHNKNSFLTLIKRISNLKENSLISAAADYRIMKVGNSHLREWIENSVNCIGKSFSIHQIVNKVPTLSGNFLFYGIINPTGKMIVKTSGMKLIHSLEEKISSVLDKELKSMGGFLSGNVNNVIRCTEVDSRARGSKYKLLFHRDLMLIGRENLQKIHSMLRKIAKDSYEVSSSKVRSFLYRNYQKFLK